MGDEIIDPRMAYNNDNVSDYDEERAAGTTELKGGEVTESGYGKRDLEL